MLLGLSVLNLSFYCTVATEVQTKRYCPALEKSQYGLICRMLVNIFIHVCLGITCAMFVLYTE